MYWTPSTEIVGDFFPEDPADLVQEYGKDCNIPLSDFTHFDWAKDILRIAGSSEVIMRLDAANTSSSDLDRVMIWHPDYRSSDGSGGRTGIRILIAASPVPTQVLAGVVPGLPSIIDDDGYALVNTHPTKINEAVQIAIEEGDAWVNELDPTKLHILRRGVLHRTPPREELTRDRIVVTSHLDVTPRRVVGA